MRPKRPSTFACVFCARAEVTFLFRILKNKPNFDASTANLFISLKVGLILKRGLHELAMLEIPVTERSKSEDNLS